MRSLPKQPEIVRQWFAHSARAERRATGILLSGSTDIIGTANAALEALHSAFQIPKEVAAAHESWRQEYNAVVDEMNRERQARINAREIAKVRAAACPSCFATHAGEC